MARRGANTRSPAAVAAPRRSLFEATYLTRAQLASAPAHMAVQRSKAAATDISGKMWEQVWAELTGGTVHPGSSNRPIPDGWRGDLAYSIKTTAVTPAASRPEAIDWLGQSVPFIISRLQPTALPAGASLDTASPTVIGRRVLDAYNQMIDIYGWDRMAFLVRLRCEDLACWQYIYWEEPVAPLNLKGYTWRDSGREHDLCRNVLGFAKGQATQQDSEAADMRWTSGGLQLVVRHTIPADADIWVVSDAEVLTREETTLAVSRAIEAKKLGIAA